MNYKIAIHRTDEGISVSVPALPGCWSEGDTEEEALAKIQDAIREYLAALEERFRNAEVLENDLTKEEKIVLMAAFYQGARPGSRFQKCWRVLVTALQMAGLRDYLSCLTLAEDECPPDMDDYYKVLISMIKRESVGERFFDGRGNLGSETKLPAYPAFTECRLTTKGAEVAEYLLQHNPDWAQ